MKVQLIQCTNDPIALMAEACKTCTGRLHEPKQDNLTLVEKVLRSGHLSVAEHVVFTFLIEGISRACTHQLVRYRHCSFSQLSQRYAKVGTIQEALAAHYCLNHGRIEDGLLIINKYFVIPKQIKEEDEEFITMLCDVFVSYHDNIDKGMKPEEARAILPNCTKTDVMVTLNLRELIHIANERLCLRAQGEIREVVQKMCELVTEDTPSLAQFLVPKCELYGRCFEKKSCGRVRK